MSRRDYPRLGSICKPQTKLCSCCDKCAVNRIDIQEDWFRGNDTVMQVCDAHLTMAREGRWKALFADHAATNAARRAQSQPRPRVQCGTCGRRVKEAGLADHMRDAHGVQEVAA